MVNKQKELLLNNESIAGEIRSHDKGMVLVSERAIPDFFNRITSCHHSLWNFFELTVTFFGIGIIAFTLIILTFYSAYGYFPVINKYLVVTPLVKASGFITGLLFGLIIHEFAHGVVLANNGIKIQKAGLMVGSMVGGFIEADETTFFQADRKVHLRFNASSIGANALAAILLWGISVLTSSGFFLYLAAGCLFFGIINSFPIRPLDGGWVYEDLVNIYVSNKQIKTILLLIRFAFVILWIVLFTYSAIIYH